MDIQFDIDLSQWNAKFGKATLKSLSNRDVEGRIINRLKHAVIAEFGSGIYGEGPGGVKNIIYPAHAKNLIIPISSKYKNKYGADIENEAKQNAAKHPDIMGKISGQMPGIIGFIFRPSMKGMKPIRMVRDAIPLVQLRLEQEFNDLFSNGKVTREGIAGVVGMCIAIWLAEIIKTSPVLTSNLKTGWTFKMPT